MGISANDFKEGRIQLIVWSPAPFPVLRQAEEPWEQHRNLSCFKAHLPTLGIKKHPKKTPPLCTCTVLATRSRCPTRAERPCPTCQLQGPQMSESLLSHITSQLFPLPTATKAVPAQRLYPSQTPAIKGTNGLIVQLPWQQRWKNSTEILL